MLLPSLFSLDHLGGHLLKKPCAAARMPRQWELEQPNQGFFLGLPDQTYGMPTISPPRIGCLRSTTRCSKTGTVA